MPPPPPAATCHGFASARGVVLKASGCATIWVIILKNKIKNEKNKLKIEKWKIMNEKQIKFDK